MKPASHRLTRETLREWIAARLDIPTTEVRCETNLVAHGMDSLEMMTIVNRLRRQGIVVTYQTFAAEPTLDKWWQVITEAAGRH
jgi:bifunctional isochorismate lyase / aryl carrier protein